MVSRELRCAGRAVHISEPRGVNFCLCGLAELQKSQAYRNIIMDIWSHALDFYCYVYL